MLDTKYRCEFILPSLRNEALETLNGLKFYLRTLEEFIDREREREISGLKQHAEQWEAVHQEDSGPGITPSIGMRFSPASSGRRSW